MIRLEMKNCDMILIEKRLKYQPYHQVKFINMNILLVKIYFHQQKIIEQARFTDSPLEKAFEKQVKTIEDQGEEQIKAIQDQGELKTIETIKKYAYNAEDTPFISKQKEIFNELVDERREKITDLDKKVNSDDLINRYKGNTAGLKFDNALNIINKIQNGEICLADMKNNQEKFKSYLGETKKGNKKTPKQMLQRLPIALAQVKAGNNSESLLN